MRAIWPVLALSLFVGGCDLLLTPDAYFEHRSCLTLYSGMSESQVLDAMGRPQDQRDSSASARVLYYGERHSDSGPMQVFLKKTGDEYVVDALACEGLG